MFVISFSPVLSGPWAKHQPQGLALKYVRFGRDRYAIDSSEGAYAGEKFSHQQKYMH